MTELDCGGPKLKVSADTTHIVGSSRLSIVIRVAVVQVHVPSIARSIRVLRRRPKVTSYIQSDLKNISIPFDFAQGAVDQTNVWAFFVIQH